MHGSALRAAFGAIVIARVLEHEPHIMCQDVEYFDWFFQYGVILHIEILTQQVLLIGYLKFSRIWEIFQVTHLKD